MRREQSLDRRRFIGGASAIAAIGMTSSFSNADEWDRAKRDQPMEMGIRLKPDLASPGGVVVPLENLTFLSYNGALDESPDRTGTCVIAFDGCVAHRFRSPGDDFVKAGHSVDIESLDPCNIYRVKRSNWVAGAVEVLGRPTPNFKHYIFTFLGFQPGVTEGAVHFECLAQGISTELFEDKPFQEILDLMYLADFTAAV